MAHGIERVILVILIWGLLLEIFVLVYFYIISQTWRFEFYYTLILFIVTFTAVILIIRAHLKLRKFKEAQNFWAKYHASKPLYSS